MSWRSALMTAPRVAGAEDVTVGEESDDLEGHDAEVVERWAEELSLRLRRQAHGEELRDAAPPRDATPP